MRQFKKRELYYARKIAQSEKKIRKKVFIKITE